MDRRGLGVKKNIVNQERGIQGCRLQDRKSIGKKRDGGGSVLLASR